MLPRKDFLKAILLLVEKKLINYDFDLFIFGSQANKAELIATDIDLGINANNPIEGSLISSIKHRLNDELPSLYTFDIVDFAKVDDSFAEVALENIEYLRHDTSKSQG